MVLQSASTNNYILSAIQQNLNRVSSKELEAAGVKTRVTVTVRTYLCDMETYTPQVVWGTDGLVL